MKTVDLRTPSLKDLCLGDTVITSKGFTFDRTENGFLDNETKLEWFYPEKEKMSHYQAVEKFHGPKRLPTKEEFEVAESHGFREVLEITSGYFWSSSVYPNYADFAYDFSGSYGGIYDGNRYSNYGAVVCVQGR